MQIYPGALLLQRSSMLLLSRVLMLALCCALCPLLMLAQSVTETEQIKTNLEKSQDKILIGDPIKLKIEIQHPVGKSYQLSIDERGLGFLELRGQPSSRTQAIDGQQANTIIEVALVPFQTGKLPIPPLLLLRNDGKQLQTAALELTVEAITAPEERTIKDVQLIPSSPTNGWLQATIIVLLLTSASLYFLARLADPYASRLLLAAIGLLARRPQPPAPTLPQPHVSLEEEMIARLRLLLTSNLAETDVKSFHVQLAEIMSEYAIRRYNAPSQEYTSAELLELLAARSVPTLVTSAFERILQACDLVKFARLQLEAETAQRSARQAIDLLNALNHGAQTTLRQTNEPGPNRDNHNQLPGGR